MNTPQLDDLQRQHLIRASLKVSEEILLSLDMPMGHPIHSIWIDLRRERKRIEDAIEVQRVITSTPTP